MLTEECAKAERPASSLDSATARLHAEIEEAHYAVNNLESRVDTVLHPGIPESAPEMGTDAPGASEHVVSLHNAADEVSRLTRRVRGILNRLEV